MALRTTIHFFVKSELSNVVPNDQQLAIIPGETTFGDTYFRWYKYDVNSSATHDGESVIQPTSVVGNGRWIKQSNYQTPVDWSASSGFQAILNKPSFATVATSGSYNDLSGKPDLSSYMTVSAANSAISTMQSDINGKVPAARTLTINGVAQDLSSNRSWTITQAAPTINNSVSRSFNSAFTVSTTKVSQVNYTVQIAASISLTTGQTGTVFLETSADGTVWTEISRFANGNTGTLTVGLALTQTVSAQLSAMVPANSQIRLRTSGTATITYITGQEIIY